MKTTSLLSVWLAACALVLGVGRASAGEVLIAAAANFTDAARDIVALFEQSSGHKTKVSFGSTGKLFSQIANGAPFEVFLAADATHPERLETEGLAVPGSRFVYARGRLALWSVRAETFADGAAYVRALDFSRLAIANPRTAPYGRAAQQTMEHLGVWARIQDRLAFGDSVAQTFQFVATGNAEAGFVAYAQIRSWTGDAGSLWLIPEGCHAPIEQQAALLQRGSENPAARAFLDFLKTAEARRIIVDYGYGLEALPAERADVPAGEEACPLTGNP